MSEAVEDPVTSAEEAMEGENPEAAPENPAPEGPTGETPVEEAPVEDAPVEAAPVEEAPVEAAPVEEAPVAEAPVAEAPVEEPVVDTPPVNQEDQVDPSPVEDAPAEKADSPKTGSPRGSVPQGGDQEKKQGQPKESVPLGKEEPKPEDKSTAKQKGANKPLFSSRGSLMASESSVKEKLQEFKDKRALVGAMISDLQAKVKAYKDKENPTDEDIAKLKKYHAAFLEKINEYEEMTRTVERMMGMTDVPSSQLDFKMSGPPMPKPVKPPASPPKRPSQQVNLFEELNIPRIIVCNTDMNDSVPRIIVCEPPKKSDLQPFTTQPPQNNTEVAGGNMMNKLNECFQTQQKLCAENAEMARLRHQMQEQLLDKQEMLDCMKQKVMALESEKYQLCNQNNDLQRQLMLSAQKPGSPPMCKRELYMKFRGTSPDMEPTSSNGPAGCCRDNMQDLDQELKKMEVAVNGVYCELEGLQKDKLALGYSANPYAPTSKRPVCKLMLPQKSTQTDEDKEKDVLFESEKDPNFKGLREQYQRLHSDFKNKVAEVAALRVDLDKTKRELEDIVVLHHELEAMHHKELEKNMVLYSDMNQAQSCKDRLVDLEQQTIIAKQMYSSSLEEVEELRSLVEEQASQLDEYRNKYLKTLQIAEELKKENEFKERECNDQISVEIQRAKLELQEHLEELNPIKDLLKITQQKLKETEQMHNIALETIAEMSQKLEEAQFEQNALKSKVEGLDSGGDVLANLQYSLEEAEKKMTELEKDNARLKEVVLQLEERQVAQNQRLDEKSHELLQMMTQLDTLREESARQVARVKERSEMIRKCLLAQISEMEREVAQCRAATAFANKERDEIRSRLQMEICLLSENFKESQNRIIQLHQHVNYLSASHPTSLIDMCQ